MSEAEFEKTPWGSHRYTDRDGDSIMVRKSHDGQLVIEVNDEAVIVPLPEMRRVLNEIDPPAILMADPHRATRASDVQASLLEEQGFEDLLADTLNAVLDEREARKAGELRARYLRAIEEEEDRLMRAFMAGRSI